jgi:uncharacterized protein
MWLKISLIIITVLFIVILIIKRFAYFRPTYEFIPIKDVYEDIREGNLHAWYKKGTSNKAILFCHGNGGNLSHRQDKLIQFYRMGHSVLIFDYNGFGHSKGVPNEQLCYYNAIVFMDVLFKRGYSNIIPYGESMGASVAAYVAHRYELPLLILESGLPSIKKLIKHWSPLLVIFSPIFTEFNTEKFLKRYTGKVLVLHSVNDEVIPYIITSSIRKGASEVVNMTGSHNNPNIPWNRIKEFIG